MCKPQILGTDVGAYMVHKIYFIVAVCDRETWTRRAYVSHQLKGSCEDQVFRYDARSLVNASCVFNLLFVGYVELMKKKN